MYTKIMRLFMLIASFLAVPTAVLAAGFDQTINNIRSGLYKAGETGFGYTQTDTPPTLGNIVGQYVTVFLGFVGTIAFVIFLYGGYLWLTARGNEDQVAEAKKYLFNGTVGIIVIVFAYSAAFFITQQLYSASR